MNIKIMGRETDFANKESEISKIFDFINKTIEEENIFLKSMVIDGIEIYDNYYEYFLENIKIIEGIEVKVQTLKELIEGIIYSSLEYMEQAVPLIKNLSNSFTKYPTEEAWNELDNLFSGIEWILDSYSSIDQHPNLNELISDYYIWNEYVVEVKNLKLVLPDFLEAVENKDTVLIGDILAYEINPLFESMIQKLKEIVKEDVENQNAN